MNPVTLLKARRLPVVRALDGSFRVGGDTDVYKVWLSRIAGQWLCSCRAGATDKVCSHRLAVQLHTKRHYEKMVASATERGI